MNLIICKLSGRGSLNRLFVRLIALLVNVVALVRAAVDVVDSAEKPNDPFESRWSSFVDEKGGETERVGVIAVPKLREMYSLGSSKMWPCSGTRSSSDLCCGIDRWRF